MDDVRYLPEVYRQLHEQLQAKRRLGWVEKDMRALSDAENYQVDESQLWKRLRGVQKLKGEKLQIASDLCVWREQLAQRRNRPRRWIAKDDAIIEIARRKPANIEQLASIPEIGDKTVKRHGAELVEIVARAGEVDPEQWPRHDKFDTLNKQQQALGDCLMALCRVIADENDIALATLALRKDIDNLILNHKSSRLTQGWRFAMAGEKLLEFMHGQSAISVDDERLRLDPR
jgi:ribonuclease D